MKENIEAFKAKIKQKQHARDKAHIAHLIFLDEFFSPKPVKLKLDDYYEHYLGGTLGRR